jgi:hypothetical protein
MAPQGGGSLTTYDFQCIKQELQRQLAAAKAAEEKARKDANETAGQEMMVFSHPPNPLLSCNCFNLEECSWVDTCNISGFYIEIQQTRNVHNHDT